MNKRCTKSLIIKFGNTSITPSLRWGPSTFKLTKQYQTAVFFLTIHGLILAGHVALGVQLTDHWGHTLIYHRPADAWRRMRQKGWYHVYTPCPKAHLFCGIMFGKLVSGGFLKFVISHVWFLFIFHARISTSFFLGLKLEGFQKVLAAASLWSRESERMLEMRTEALFLKRFGEKNQSISLEVTWTTDGMSTLIFVTIV